MARPGIASLMTGMLVVSVGAVAIVATSSSRADAAAVPSRSGTYVPTAKETVYQYYLSAHESRIVAIDRNYYPPAPDPVDQVAAALDVSVLAPETSGTLTVSPGGTGATRQIGAVQFRAGKAASSLIVADMSYTGTTKSQPSGEIKLVNNSVGTVEVLVANEGYFAADYGSSLLAPPAGGFQSVPSVTLFDTVSGVGLHSPLAAYGTDAIKVRGTSAGIPTTASAIFVQVTAVDPAATGYLVAYPHGAGRPGTQMVAFSAKNPATSLAIVPIAADGDISVSNVSSQKINFRAIAVGYLTGGTPSAPGSMHSYGAWGLFSTISGLAVPKTPLAGGRSLTIPVAGHTGVPITQAGMVAISVTTSGATGTGQLEIDSSDNPTPYSFDVNYSPGPAQSNLVLVPIGIAGKIRVSALGSGSVQIVASTEAYARSSTLIYGRVTDTAGHAVPDSVIYVQSADLSQQFQITTSWAGGYAIAVPPGTWNVCFVGSYEPPTGYAPSCWYRRSDYVPPSPLSLALGQETDANGILSPGADISGKTVDPAGNPIKALVTVSRSVPTKFGAGGLIPSSADGTFDFPGLDPGSYNVCASFTQTGGDPNPQDFVPVCADGNPVWADHTSPIALTTGQKLDLPTLTLPYGGEVSGTVSSSADIPRIAGLSIDAWIDGRIYEQAYTANDGTYTLHGIPAGQVEVCAEGYAYYEADGCYGGTSADVATPVTVTARQATSGIDISLATGGRLVLTTDTSDGSKPTDISVTISSPDYTHTFTPVSTGYWSVGVVPANYTICESAPGYTTNCFGQDDGGGTPAALDVPKDVVTRATITLTPS